MASVTLTVGAATTAATLAIAAALIGGAATASQRLVSGADAAALAAADVASGAVASAGSPCEVAATVAAASGAHLDDCRFEGFVAIVQVSSAYAGVTAVARSRAGPPEVAADDG